MNKMKKLILTSMIATTGIMGTSIVASATVRHVGGGTWNYGLVNNNPYYMAYSYYYHGKKPHTSSVRLGGSKIYRSDITAKGYTSQVNSPTKYKESNAEYWWNTL